jgi:DNA/RNA-binding domain of Phe-tRNA-synthetase-like protein
MLSITIDQNVKEACPALTLGLIACEVKNSAYNEALWNEIGAAELTLRSNFPIEQINKIPAICATREAYKALGKDPNRYRPSAEALCRRILRSLPLYKINTLVDLINLVSIRTGYSIGGFDADKIEGNNLLLTAGTVDDTFEGIGRGALNIEGLPVYKDAVGGIGTPTSDHERTKLSVETTHLLMIINGYSGSDGITGTVAWSVDLLKKYAGAIAIETEIM